MLDEAAEKKAAETGPEDELPANSLQGPAVSKPRDLWIQGPHRLLCGELDPLSCDVVVRPWQPAALLGKERPPPRADEGQCHVRKTQSHSRRAARISGQRIGEHSGRRVRGWPRSSAAGQAVAERWSIAKSPWTAAERTVDGSGRQEGVRAGHQQEGLGSPRR